MRKNLLNDWLGEQLQRLKEMTKMISIPYFYMIHLFRPLSMPMSLTSKAKHSKHNMYFQGFDIIARTATEKM